MPTRTYTGLDLQNYVATFSPTSPSPPATETYSPGAQGSGSINVSDSQPTGAPTFSVSNHATSSLSLYGEIDYENTFPRIPVNALITRLEFSYVGSSVQSAQAFLPASFNYNCSAVCSATFQASMGLYGLLPDSILVDHDVDAFSSFPGMGAQNVAASLSMNVGAGQNTVIDFPGGVSRDYLQETFGSVTLFASFGATPWDFSSDSYSGGPNGCTCSITGSISLGGFTLTITYESGPEVHFTTDPADGSEVEPGESITITSDGEIEVPMDELNYFAIAPNGKVIPIIPKFTDDENVVILEVPPPETTPCFDCIGPGKPCPDCLDCATACAESFGTEACQECLQDCLDCLAECLDTLGQLEECKESGPEGGGTYVFYASDDPGQRFSGSVPLGSFTVLVAEASGIYRFVDGKTNDTLYRSTRDGTTYDMKIPNPRGKTGFFRS